MTATVSTNKTPVKTNPALHNWKSNIKGSKKFITILTILHLVAVPAVLIAYIISVYMNKYPGEDLEMYAVIAICTTCLAAFLGIFTAVDSFRCLNDKSLVDMKLALPMNDTQRFLSNFLSGLFTYLAPFFATQVLSLLLCGYGCLFMDGKTFYHLSYTIIDGESKEIPVPYVCDTFGYVMPALLKLIAGGTLCMLMLYVISVFITVCCGNKFEAIAYTILINILIPLTILCVFFSMFNSLYGINAEELAIKIMLYISVAGGVIATADWATQGELLYVTNTVNYGIWMLVFFLIIAALFALSFFLYRKRRAEQVSKPFVFKLVYYVIVTCAIFCIVSLFFSETDEIVPAIILSAICYMIFEVVTNRGFKRFWVSAIKYVVTFVAIIGVLVTAEKTDGFGAVQRVPSVSEVKSIEVDYAGFYRDFYPVYDNYTGKSMPLYQFRDKENIETIISAHQAIIDYYNEHKSKYNKYNYYGFDEQMTSNDNITITYNLKTGGSFTRTYYSYSSVPTEILTAIDLSEEYRRQAAESHKNYILNAEKYYLRDMELRAANDENDYYDPYEYEVTVHNKINSYGGITSPKQKSTRITMESLITRDFFTQLADAYYKDIMAITEENYYRSELKNEWQLNIHHSGISLSIPESFTNTVELLEYFDFGLVRVEELSDKDIYQSLINAASSSQFLLLRAEEYRNVFNVDEGLPLHASYSTYLGYEYREITEAHVYDFDESIGELLRNAMPRNIVAENGYVIYVSSFTGAIPDELTGYASSVQRSGRDSDKEAQYSQLFSETYYN